MNEIDRIIRSAADLEQKIITKVCSSVLGREVTLDDGQLFTMVSHEHLPWEYTLLYKDETIGILVRKFEGLKFSIEFIPAGDINTDALTDGTEPMLPYFNSESDLPFFTEKNKVSHE